MKIWVVSEDGCVDHWIIASDKEKAIEMARETRKDMSGEGFEPDAEITVKDLSDESLLTINMEGIRIQHTCTEWIAIYNHKEIYLACSEY